MESKHSPKNPPGCGCYLVGAGILLVVAVVTVLVVYLVWSAGASRRARAALARVRAKGEPTTPAELDEFYPISREERDAATAWLIAVQPLDTREFSTAAEGLPIVGGGEEEIPPPGQPWPQLEAAEELLGQYERQLALLHEAAQAARPARYPLDFSQGLAMRMDHIPVLRAGSCLLELEAHVQAHRGDPHGVARSIHAILTLAESLNQEPTIISQLVRIACNATAVKLVEGFVSTVEFSDDDLRVLQERFRALDPKDGLRRAMIGERVFGLVCIENPSAIDAAGLEGLLQPIRQENVVSYLACMGRILAATEKPWPEALAEADRIQAELELARSNSSLLAKGKSFASHLLVPAIRALFVSAARGTAQNRSADAAIAVELYRRQHGRLPEQLADLVPEFLPEVPIDPFDGQPLRYVVREDEYVVYSIGQDGDDDGGRDLSEEKDYDPDDSDVAFRVRVGRPLP